LAFLNSTDGFPEPINDATIRDFVENKVVYEPENFVRQVLRQLSYYHISSLRPLKSWAAADFNSRLFASIRG